MSGYNRNNIVFAFSLIVILLASTLLGPEVLFAQTIHYSFLTSSSSSPLALSTTRVTDVAFVIHPHKSDTRSDPPSPPSTIAASSSSSALSSSTNASLIQITGGKVQDLSFTINNNNLPATPAPFNLPTSLTDLVVSLTSQNNSVRILGPSTWNLPTILPRSVQKLTTQVYASTTLVGSPVFFSVNIQYIQNSHQVKTTSFNLGALVIGDIQLSVNNVGIRYIGNTPNLVGNILNKGNTPAQFASVEMLTQGQGQNQTTLPSISNSNPGKNLISSASQYLGNIATNSPVPFNLPFQPVQFPLGKAEKQLNATAADNNISRGSIPSTLLSKARLNQSTSTNFAGILDNIATGIYPISLKITYVDDLKNNHEVIIKLFGAQSSSIQQAGGSTTATSVLEESNSSSGPQPDPQLTSNNGFVDAYWASNTARVSNTNGTVSMQGTPVPQQQEVGPGEGQSILAVQLSNTEFSNINGIIGYLTLPPGFSSATGGIGYNNTNSIGENSAQIQGQQPRQQVAIATNNLGAVMAGHSYTLYFKVNVGKTATLGNHLSFLRVYYFKVPDLEPGQYSSQAFTVPFTLPGKVILDTIPSTTSLNPGVSNLARIEIKNQGSAEAHSVIVSVTGISGNSISGSNVGSSTASGNSVNSTTGPGAQITTITPQSSIPTVNLGARTFNIGTIPVNGRAEINTIMYPSYSAGGTLQNLNLQISYANAVGSTVTSSYTVGFLVLPTPPQAGITVTPFAGQTLPNNNNSSTTNTNSIPGNSNNNTGTTMSPSTNLSSSLHSNTTSPSDISGNNNRNSGKSSGGITVSPSSYTSSSMPQTITDSYRINNNTPIVPLVYKIAEGNNTGTTTSATVAHASSNAHSYRSGAAISKSATASSNNNQLNSTSLILVAGNTEDMKFSVANNNDVPITNAVVSIASQSNGLKIVGDTLWSLASLGPHSTHQFSTKIFASASLIAQPVSFLVTMQYISRGQSQVGSFILGGTVIGSIRVTASGIGINYIAGVPNLVGNLLNQGNTIGLYSTVQLINQPFSTANQSTTNQQQQPHHQHQAPITLPPSQYLGDLQPDSPLPFSIPLTANINNTAPGIYPVKLEVTYSDDLKNSHTTILNNTVQLAPQQPKARNGQGGGIFGFLTGGASHGRGGGAGGSSNFLGIPLLFWIAIIAAIVIAFILIRRRRGSKAALTTADNGPEEEGDIRNSDEDIESLIDNSHKPSDTKKEGGSSKPPI
ncbi:MAG TPA: hypothetical protein VFI73_11680 [Candidatus Nitrosopolaris sp.]|nr:hypothetical protein [Candidatus Nitrosopolaris sp.]